MREKSLIPFHLIGITPCNMIKLTGEKTGVDDYGRDERKAS